MKNIDMTVRGSVLTIKIDLSKDHGESKSGLSTIVASTGGNQTIPGHDTIKIGINVFKQK